MMTDTDLKSTENRSKHEMLLFRAKTQRRVHAKAQRCKDAVGRFHSKT